jgi:hypothetical protein
VGQACITGHLMQIHKQQGARHGSHVDSLHSGCICMLVAPGVLPEDFDTCNASAVCCDATALRHPASYVGLHGRVQVCAGVYTATFACIHAGTYQA